LQRAGYSLHAVLTIAQLLKYWEETGKVEKQKIADTRDFLKQSN
jgi:orotate phosphoribosyltransferase